MSIYDGAETDIQDVCKALLEDYSYYNNSDYPPFGYECNCCKSNVDEDLDSIIHEQNCPVLKARDLLTRITN